MKLTKREKKQAVLSTEGTPAISAQPAQRSSKKKSYRKYFVISAISALLVFLIVYGVYSYAKPGPYDNFAKCITGKGAVVYGALSWCKYTQAQKAMFGNSFKYLNYKEHTEMPGIKKTPTWIINGMWYENVQSIDKLSQVTGCEI